MEFQSKPITSRSPALLTRMRLGAQLWLMKMVVAAFTLIQGRRISRLPLHQKPTYTKYYGPVAAESRIFIPKSYKPGDPPLPLLIDIHGGGFCIGSPMLDDPDNLILAHTHSFCVVSIPYRLGPRFKFPIAPKDCAAAITAVLDDDSLPVDKSRVAVAGYSAGGNLALTATQLPGVKGRIKGVAAYYPVTDFTLTIDQKIAGQKVAPDGKDVLHWMSPMFNNGYLEHDVDRKDPLLSPIFAKREDLPEHISILGCEYDMLCKEAESMAENLATLEAGEKTPLLDGKVGWTKGSVRWELIEGEKHGFNQSPVRGEKGRLMREKATRMHGGIAEWLKKEVYT
ncbi:alpha/beta-hydrolase [Lentithecium fluviatile CBS 122367]|uniref:Alpha/beta-hydrolase n=1 Tax=Lentithecium fluviatile CBS 122367 TaxID=1168545 RepID=A0A6G1IUH9_9PLEO|nr:alpha/beta-hydrolase [Lentithecium fluviatile CBS 122367]